MSCLSFVRQRSLVSRCTGWVVGRIFALGLAVLLVSNASVLAGVPSQVPNTALELRNSGVSDCLSLPKVPTNDCASCERPKDVRILSGCVSSHHGAVIVRRCGLICRMKVRASLRRQRRGITHY